MNLNQDKGIPFNGWLKKEAKKRLHHLLLKIKNMKKTIILLFFLSTSLLVFAQNKDAGAAKEVLKKYNTAVEKLDVAGTEKLFTADSKIFESGGSEGTYAHYLEHHLIPEFKEFTSFKYNDYKVEVQVDGNYAFATETYGYTIVVAKDKSEVKRKGVTTSVLKKAGGEWKIMVSHNSSRRG